MERIGIAPGTEVGGYRIAGPLGHGGMGAVYRAVDGGGAPVALKLLHPHLGHDPDARERLRREVRHLQRLRHPGVARVLDAEIDSSEAFVVTELLEGQDLGARVRSQGPLPPDELAALAGALHEALVAVHAAGVLHRDLSPGNVLLTERGPVLIDFGIAQAADETRVTSTGLVAGTPGYLSPESLEGEPPSATGDWWGWAALLAFATTGRPPFGPAPVAAVLARVRRGEVDLEGAPPAVAAALRPALTVDPARRADPEDVVAALEDAALDPWAERVDETQDVHGATAVLPVTLPAPPGDSTLALPVPAATDDSLGDETFDAAFDDEAFDDEAPATLDPDVPGYPDLPGPPPLPEARRRTGTVLGLATVLLALGLLRPGVAVVVGVVLAVLVRSVGLDVDALHARQGRRGRRRADRGLAVAAWPWYLLRAAVGVLPAALVAASAVLVIGGVGWWLLGTGRLSVTPDGTGASGGAAWVEPALLALTVLVGLTCLWFGPLARRTRAGARWTLAALAPGAAGAVTAVVLALAVAAVLVAAALTGQEVGWWPLPGPPDVG